MAAHASLPSPAQFPSVPGYSQSPLRTVQLQSEVRTPGRRALRSATLDDISRRNSCSYLQKTIHDALGSSAPVDLLPHVSKRASIRHRRESVTSLDEGLRLLAIDDATTVSTFTNGTQPTIQEEQTDPTPQHGSARILEDVLYATVPGCRAGRGI
jgi:hypothetical protein